MAGRRSAGTASALDDDFAAVKSRKLWRRACDAWTPRPSEGGWRSAQPSREPSKVLRSPTDPRPTGRQGPCVGAARPLGARVAPPGLGRHLGRCNRAGSDARGLSSGRARVFSFACAALAGRGESQAAHRITPSRCFVGLVTPCRAARRPPPLTFHRPPRIAWARFDERPDFHHGLLDRYSLSPRSEPGRSWKAAK